MPFLHLHLYGFEPDDPAPETEFYCSLIAQFPDPSGPIPPATCFANLVLHLSLFHIDTHAHDFVALEGFSLRIPCSFFYYQFDGLESFLPSLVVSIANTNEPFAILSQEPFSAALSGFEV